MCDLLYYGWWEWKILRFQWIYDFILSAADTSPKIRYIETNNSNSVTSINAFSNLWLIWNLVRMKNDRVKEIKREEEKKGYQFNC